MWRRWRGPDWPSRAGCCVIPAPHRMRFLYGRPPPTDVEVLGQGGTSRCVMVMRGACTYPSLRLRRRYPSWSWSWSWSSAVALPAAADRRPCLDLPRFRVVHCVGRNGLVETSLVKKGMAIARHLCLSSEMPQICGAVPYGYNPIRIRTHANRKSPRV